MKMRKHKEALQDADAAIDADGAFAKGYLRRAAANEALENFEDAVRDYEKVDLTSTCAFQSTNLNALLLRTPLQQCMYHDFWRGHVTSLTITRL